MKAMLVPSAKSKSFAGLCLACVLTEGFDPLQPQTDDYRSVCSHFTLVIFAVGGSNALVFCV
jgi:hypothetical protein